MRVVLFRHGPAGHADPSRWPDDDLRPLTPRGIERTRLAARGLVRLEPRIQIVMTSPLVRAVETAEILEEALRGDKVRTEVVEALSPDQPPAQVIERLASLDADATVALVGHEPLLGALAGALVSGGRARLALKKAGACAIEIEGKVAVGAGELEWLVPPKALRRMAGKKAAT
jgi:phosphohistidine phosphatase